MGKRSRTGVKATELRLVAELVRDCRRSDRQLAKALGISQPTVSRLLKRLENDGYVDSYMMLPNFQKLGLSLLCLTFAKFERALGEKELKEMTEYGVDMERRLGYPPAFLIMFGEGMGYDAVVGTFHESFSSYSEFQRAVRSIPHLDLDKLSSFIIDLNDPRQIRPLSFGFLADFIKQRERAVGK